MSAVTALADPEPHYTVSWTKTWDGPILPMDRCPHGGADALTLNQRIVSAKGGRRRITMDGSVCMRCGAETTGALTIGEALARCHADHGWDYATSRRLYDLAEHHEDLIREQSKPGDVWPIWFFHAWGWSGREIADALNSGELVAGEPA